MKKFLFTLAALLMAGSAFAANVYIADKEFTAEEIGTNVWLDVMVELDNEYINAWDFAFEFPENLTVTSSIRKNTAVLTQEAVTDEFGTTENVAFTVNGDAYHTAAFCAQAGFWDPDGDEEYEMYGAVKIGPTGTFMLYQIRVNANEAFTGGDIKITWMVSGGFDYRNGQTKVNASGETIVALTVEGGDQPEVTATPVITYDEDTFTVTATGDGEVKLYVDGKEVENPYTFELGEEETTYIVTATAQEQGKEISETATLEVTVPAAPVVILPTPKPIIDVLTDQESETVTVRATGQGHICIYWDEQLMAEGYDGVAEWVIPFGDDPEGEEYGVSATAQEEGYLVSEYALATVFVPGKSGEQPPYETPAPTITANLTDDGLLLTAEGEGTVTIYVQIIDNETGEMTTETYEGEGSVSVVVPRGDEDYYINYWAVAQADEDAIPGTTEVEYFVEVPAKEDIPYVDPDHEQGVWIVTYYKDGTERWDEMLASNNDYTCIVRFSYGNYGTFPYDPNKSDAENDALRPNENFYIVIDGVRYGAAEDGTLCVLGTALNNQLFAEGSDYVLENALGRVYNMGVAIDETDPTMMYVYAAVAAYTEIEEMNASKAVAGVRYFNMAGQEMQEANGMTIVVTTYTDGTTSAVKVMK